MPISPAPRSVAIVSALAGVAVLEVWRRLGGGELRHGGERAFWRGCTGDSLAMDEARRRWFNPAAAAGHEERVP